MKKIGLSLLFSILIASLFATVTFANQDLPNLEEPDHNDFGVTIDEFDRVNPNANNTGSGVTEQDNFDEVIKAVDGHRTHGDYQSNTNSCASCHQTHTAAAGSRLTFADNNFKTCVACHDGTLGFYNVFETGENASLDGAGTFAGTHGASVHMANGSLKINAAPGGSRAQTGVWNADFSCASCHTPHGSYSDRLLHFNPNGFATNPKASVTYKNAQGTDVTKTFGNYEQNLGIFDAGSYPTSGLHLRRSVTGTGADEVVKIELFNGNTKQTSPWLYGYSGHGQPHFTRLYKTTDAGSNGGDRLWYGNGIGVKFNLEAGYVTNKIDDVISETGATKLKEMTHGHISRPYIVKLALEEVQDIDGLKIYKTNQAAFWDGFVVPESRRAEFTSAGYTVNGTTGATSNMGVRMSEYCATCHTDYYTARTASGNTYFGENGTVAQRHSTNSDRFSCVRCHFAHGTDAEIMIDANGNTVKSLVDDEGMDKQDAITKMLDVNPSSALKKYTNMSVCWACHGSSSRATTFKNGGARNADAMDGMPVVGGVQR